MAGIFIAAGILMMSTKLQPVNNSEVSVVKVEPTKPSTTLLLSAVSPSLIKQDNSNTETTQFKNIKRITLDPSRTVALIGEVGENALQASAMITEMSARSSDPIYLVLSGPGGSVVTGGILISAIQASKAPVYTICDVLCASMDSMIHQYGAKRYMTDRTIIMFHPASAGTQGDVDRMYSMVSFLKRFTNKMEMEVSKRQGLTFAEYKLKTSTELWIDAEDAFAAHINDGIVNFQVLRSASFESNSPQEKKKTDIKSTKKNNIIQTPDIKWICENSLCKEALWTNLK